MNLKEIKYCILVCLATLLFTTTCTNLYATTYYISNDGNDSNPGTSESLSWKTLHKLSNSFLKPGDQVLFRRGDIWKGAIKINFSGRANSPIVYGAYGEGAKPIISGFTTVTDWTDRGANIWESTNAVSTLSTCNMVVITGTNTPMGRTPNQGYFYFQSHTNNYNITSTNLTGVPNWSGAELAFNINNWETKRCPIINQSGRTLTFTQPESFTIWENNLKFIIQNDVRTLDEQNEWYYSPSTKKLFIYSTSEPADVKVSAISALVTLSDKNYLTFQNIEFTGSNDRAISISNSDFITVDNCEFNYSGLDAVHGVQSGTSNNLSVLNCTFNNSNNGAIGVDNEFPNATISGNIITNTGMIYGANSVRVSGTNNSGILYGISAQGSGSTIEYNRIQNTGYVGIRYLGSNTKVRYNFVENFCQINHDGGGIYTWNGSNTAYSGTEVSNNIVINDSTVKEVGHEITIDAGIYLDQSSNGIEVHHNTIETPLATGIRVNDGHDLNLNNNNIFNCLEGVRFRRATLTDVSSTYNTIIAKKSNQYVYRVLPAESVINGIDSDYNILDRPIDRTEIVWCYIETPVPKTEYQSLTEWQSYSKQDINSNTSPVTITSEKEIQLIYNNTNKTKMYDPGGAVFLTIAGDTLSGSFTLNPFTSIIIVGKNFGSINQKPVIPDQSFKIKSPKFSNDTVGQVFAFDEDTSQVLKYFIFEGDQKNWFSVDSVSGKLYVKNDFYAIMNQSIELQLLVKDNSINSLSDSAKITIYIDGTDSSPPEITSFSIPSHITSFYVPIDSFLVMDNWGIMGYMLTDTPDMPEVNDSNWEISIPTFYRTVKEGSIVLYAWILDSANYISGPATDTINLTFPDTSFIHSEYLFEEDSSLIITDSHSIYDGAIIGNIERIDGVLNSGLNFDGNGYINLRNSYSENVKDQITLSAWIKPEISNSDLPIITHSGFYGNTFELYINADSSSITFITNGTTNSNLTVKNIAELWDGNWHHLAVTYDGFEKIIYIDKKVISRIDVTGNINSGFWNDLYLGAKIIANDTLRYMGGIDEVQIYNYALDENVIGDLYDSINKIINRYTSFEFVSICEGADYMGWTETGEYTRSFIRKLSSASGADSIITTHLIVNPTYNIEQEATICSGDTFRLGNQELFNTGEYSIIFESIQGCDSIVHLNLIVNPKYETTENITIGSDSNYNGWTTAGIYKRILVSETGCDSTIITNLNIIQTYTQHINLEQGWNIFSSYIIPSSLNLEDILKNLQTQNQLIEVQDEHGNTYTEEGNGWFNNIGDIEETRGYYIRVHSSCILDIRGSLIALPINIELNEGWNIISFPYNGSVDAMEIIDPLINDGILEKVQDEKGNSIEKWDGIGWINGIGDFHSGEGYLVQVKRQSVLPILSEYDKSGIYSNEDTDAKHFTPIYVGNGFGHMNINLIGLNELNLLSGDEIAAFDGENCVGVVELQEFDVGKNIVSIKASASDEDVSNGFVEGNRIYLRIWQKSSNSEFQLITNVLKGDMSYERQGSVFAQLLQKSIIHPNTNNNLEFNIQPNPADDNVAIAFLSVPEADTKILITDLSGNIITVMKTESSFVQLDIRSFSSGIYLVKALSGMNYYIKQLIVI